MRLGDDKVKRAEIKETAARHFFVCVLCGVLLCVQQKRLGIEHAAFAEDLGAHIIGRQVRIIVQIQHSPVCGQSRQNLAAGNEPHKQGMFALHGNGVFGVVHGDARHGREGIRRKKAVAVQHAVGPADVLVGFQAAALNVRDPLHRALRCGKHFSGNRIVCAVKFPQRPGDFKQLVGVAQAMACRKEFAVLQRRLCRL